MSERYDWWVLEDVAGRCLENMTGRCLVNVTGRCLVNVTDSCQKNVTGSVTGLIPEVETGTCSIPCCKDLRVELGLVNMVTGRCDW